MSVISLTPCGHSLSPEQTINSLEEMSREIVINETAHSAFAQINEQLQRVPLNCPLCKRVIEKIEPGNGTSPRFPISRTLFKKLQISPLNVNLQMARNSNAIYSEKIRFKKIELANIINSGQVSNDNGITFRHCAELANDFNGLVSSFGNVFGRILYWLPTSWKAQIFIGAMEMADERQLIHLSWIMSNEAGQCIGLFDLSKIPNEKYELDEDLSKLKLYNVGVFLHSNFQRRGVVTQVTNRIFDQFTRLNLDIDGLWIMTRVDNQGVNHIAKKLNFTFIKTMNVKHGSLLPFFSESMNLYVKKL